MEPHAGIFILCLLCIVRISEMHPEKKTEFEMGSLTYEDLSGISLGKTDGINGQFTNKSREKRALGLLLSGLAQIFGYSVTPIQIASLPNPSTMRPAMMPNPMRNNTKQQSASSRPVSMNTTAQQETIRFTGVLNFGNNSDIIGHLQRYEQIFHGSDNNSMMSAMMAPTPSVTPSAKPSATTSTNSQRKPPLLTPFFVKIPLPIAPNLPPPTMPIEDFKYPAPLFSIVNESNKNAVAPIRKEQEIYPTPLFSIMNESNNNAVAPIRKEQETIYRNNKNTEQYTLEEKEIYDEKEVNKPESNYNHQLHTDDSSYNQQQNDKSDKVQHKQQEHIDRLKEQNEQRNREKDTHYNEDELNEKNRNREEEITNRSREYTSAQESKEEQSPARDDEEEENSAESYEEHASQQTDDSGESSKQSTEDEEDKTEGYSDSDKNADPNTKQFDENKYSSDSFDKYIEPDYNRELPIGDYFHENNPEVIRDSYGKALDDKKLEDDRLSSYFSMFKQPSSEYEHSQEKVRNPEDAGSEEDEKQTSVTQNYEQVNKALQKLEDEYALPKNKYEEYDINYEGESDREDRDSKRIQNTGTSARSKKPKANRLHGAKDSRAERPIETNRNEAPPSTDIARPEVTNSQEEVDFTRYTPLIVPVRYIDASDKMEQATTTRTKNKNKGQKNKSPRDQFLEDKIDSAVSNENLAPFIGLPERPRQLHEEERKELQIWPPPFDYVFDNTEPTNTVILPNLQNYPPNYQYIVKNIVASDANKSLEPSSDYVLILDNPVQNPYSEPHNNIHYFPNEATNANQNLHLNVADTYSQEQAYVPQQNVTQQFSQASPNITEYKEIAKDFRDYYYQPQEIPIDHLDSYRYIFEKHISQDKESPNVDTRSQITHTKKDTSGIHPNTRSETIEQSLPIELQTTGFTQNNSPKRSRNSQLLQKRQRNSRSENQRKDDGKMNNFSRQSIQRDISFEFDPESMHGFFGLKKANNNFESESGVSRITEENDKTAKISSVLVAPELIAYQRNRSPTKSVAKPEHDMEKANVREYRNKLTRMSEQKRLRSNEPVHYV